jgi:hypothetical protein
MRYAHRTNPVRLNPAKQRHSEEEAYLVVVTLMPIYQKRDACTCGLEPLEPPKVHASYIQVATKTAKLLCAAPLGAGNRHVRATCFSQTGSVPKAQCIAMCSSGRRCQKSEEISRTLFMACWLGNTFATSYSPTPNS